MSQPRRTTRGGLDRHLGFNLCLAREASFQAFVAHRPLRHALLIGENPGPQTALGAVAGHGKSTLPRTIDGLG